MMHTTAPDLDLSGILVTRNDSLAKDVQSNGDISAAAHWIFYMFETREKLFVYNIQLTVPPPLLIYFSTAKIVIKR